MGRHGEEEGIGGTMANSRRAETWRRRTVPYSESTLKLLPGEILYYNTGQEVQTTGPGGDSWIFRAANGF